MREYLGNAWIKVGLALVILGWGPLWAIVLLAAIGLWPDPKVAAYDDNTFMGSQHKTRRYIADRQDLLYIDSPHLTEQHSRRIGSHWMVTNIGRPETLAIARAAAATKGVKPSVWSQISF